MTNRVSMRDLVKAMDDLTIEEEIRRSEEVVLRLTHTKDPDGKMQLLTAQCHLMAVRSEQTLRTCRMMLGHTTKPAPAPLPSNVVSLSAWKQTHKQ